MAERVNSQISTFPAAEEHTKDRTILFWYGKKVLLLLLVKVVSNQLKNMLVKLDHCPKKGYKNKKYLKPPLSLWLLIFLETRELSTGPWSMNLLVSAHEPRSKKNGGPLLSIESWFFSDGIRMSWFIIIPI